MATILGMKRRFEKLDTDVLIRESVEENAGNLRELNLRQLYDGKTSKGTNIRPSYFEDPYFANYQQAAAYSDWKDKITPNPRRTPGTPNLFINGFYHRSREVAVSGDTIVHKSRWSEGDDIERKFADIDGLGGPYKESFLKNYVMPVLSDKLYRLVGLKIIK